MVAVVTDIGIAAKYTFATGFTTLNGVYVLRSVSSFSVAKANAYPIDTVWTAAGSTESYSEVWTTYQNDRVLQLESITDSSVVYYVPETLIATVPDQTVVAVRTISLRVSIGQWTTADLASVGGLKGEVDDMIAAVTGTTNQTSVHAADTTYLTQAEYDVIKAERAANAASVDSLMRQLIVARETIVDLKARVAAYEAHIKTLAGVTS